MADGAVTGLNLSTDERRILGRGEATYKELCAACHGPDGKGAPMGGATDGTHARAEPRRLPRVLGNADYITKVLLHGLTGELDGKNFPGGGVMVPMGTNTDDWIADVASYVAQQLRQQRALRHARARRRRAQGESAHLDVVLRRTRVDDAAAAPQSGAVEGDG